MRVASHKGDAELGLLLRFALVGIGWGWTWTTPSGQPPGAACEFHQELQPESNLKPVILAWSFCNDWAAAIQ